MNKFERKYFNTQKKMCDALVTLLNKKDFMYITVKDICGLANVNRSTFYLHYENMSQLLEDVMESLESSFNEYFKGINAQDILLRDKNDLFLITDEFVIPYLNFVKENKNIYKAIKKNNINVTKSYEMMYKNVFSPIMSKFGAKEEHKIYIMEFYMRGLSSIILRWCASDCDLEIDEVATLIKGLIKL